MACCPDFLLREVHSAHFPPGQPGQPHLHHHPPPSARKNPANPAEPSQLHFHHSNASLRCGGFASINLRLRQHAECHVLSVSANPTIKRTKQTSLTRPLGFRCLQHVHSIFTRSLRRPVAPETDISQGRNFHPSSGWNTINRGTCTMDNEISHLFFFARFFFFFSFFSLIFNPEWISCLTCLTSRAPPDRRALSRPRTTMQCR